MANFKGQLEMQLSLLRTINPNLSCSLDRVLNEVSVRHFVEIVIFVAKSLSLLVPGEF